MSLKENLINKMMGDQFKNMSSEEKQKMMENMMDKFFSSMSDAEKKEMMSGMMPGMMGKMMGDSGGSPMMGMMSMMMGRKGEKGEKGDMKSPMDCCKDMMSNFSETANSAKFATPELRGLFNEWCQQIENELLEFVKTNQSVDINAIMEKFNLSEESVRYILNRLASKNLIDFKV
jgi:hypothetical protein